MTRLSKILNSKLGPLFYKIADNSNQVYWLRSVDFQKQLYVSPAFEKFWPYQIEELYANPAIWLKAIVEGDRDRVRQQFMEWQASSIIDRITKIRYRIRNKYDEIIHVEDTAVPIFDGDKCVAFVGVVSDVTGCSSHLNNDERASQYFKFFIEKSDSVFWVTDPSGKQQIYVNAAYEKIWQRSVESRLTDPSTWYESVLPEDRDKCGYPAVHESITHSGNANLYRILTPSGETRWIKGKSFAVYGANDQLVGYAGIEDDVTNDVLRENELREAKDNAERANEAKSDFLAMITHDKKKPLNAILGMAQILSQSGLTRTQQGQIDVIIQAGGNLLDLLNDILDFTKLQFGKLEFTEAHIKLHDLLNALEKNVSQQLENKSLKFHCQFDKDVPKIVIGDEKRLQQILTNLVSNAVKYTHEGEVNIHTTCLQRNDKQTVLCFTVEDTGIGIEKTKLDTIFNRFQQIDSVYQRKQQGVGLGLAIVKELVELMCGNITVSSEVGIGSQFSCIIPFDLPDSDLGRTLEQDHSYNDKNVVNTSINVSVLIVEDNEINQKISKTMLEKIGCQVEIAENAQQALSKNMSNYDIIFMDLGLPDMDGFEATSKIRQNELPGQRIPIIAMTAHVFERDQEKCFTVGMDEVVAKPIMQDDLVNVIRRFVPVTA